MTQRVRAGRAALVGAAVWAGAVALNRSLRRVRGDSMSPTLEPGDLIVVVPAGRPRRGEVVLARDPREPGRTTVKRIIGLPGERVTLRRGRLGIDGTDHVEPYAAGVGPGIDLVVPAGHVVVLGDARGRSTDSRVFGPIASSLVEGRVVGRVDVHARRLSTVHRMITPTD